MLRNQGVGAPASAVIIYRCSDYTDTLLAAFIKHYNKEGIKFQGDIPCIAHVLNLVIQDILKALIKNDYDTSYKIDIYNQEKELLEENKEGEEEKGEEEQVISKSLYNLI